MTETDTQKKRKKLRELLGTAALLVLVTPLNAAVTIDLATVAPDGSNWSQILKEMGFQWRQQTGGEVRLRLFAGGVAGDEGEVIRRMRIGQLEAAAISDGGLTEIDKSAYALMIPGMFSSYEEWDYVRNRLKPEMEAKLSARGFVVLAWSDVGWVHFFSKSPVSTPAELRKVKLAASATDTVAVEIMKRAELNPVPITMADMITGLRTGLIDAFYLPIIFAESSNLYREARNMTSLKWVPLQGALIVTQKAWDRIKPEHREIILKVARQTGEKLKQETRQREADSLAAMTARGLKVCRVRDEDLGSWQSMAEKAYPLIRERLVSPEVFDRVQGYRDEFRRLQAGSRSDREISKLEPGAYR